ncbi:hypothetical protein BLOT_000778 [Blomia tropicalis]|nr:hypothetical protein BLOT_000778 [Blomia tropicalis]
MAITQFALYIYRNTLRSYQCCKQVNMSMSIVSAPQFQSNIANKSNQTECSYSNQYLTHSQFSVFG